MKRTKKQLSETFELAAAESRFDEIVKILRERHVCNGWRLDEELVARAKEFFRTGGDDDFYEGLTLFTAQHEQSLDWIMRGEIFSMVCMTASHSPQASDEVWVNPFDVTKGRKPRPCAIAEAGR